VYHGLYSEAVVSSVATAVALVDVGRFKEAVEYVQKAAKALYEAAREVFEKVKVTVQRLVELFIEAVVRALAWIDEHRAYLFLMAAVAAGAVALPAALDIWGLIELDKLAYAASAAPFFPGLAETGGKAAERFRVVADRWRVDENEKQKIEEVINEVINAPQKGKRPFLTLTRLENLPPPLAGMEMALGHIKDEVVKDAAVIATLVLYKTLINNAGVYREWAGWYKWARGLVERQEFTVAAGKIRELLEAHRRLEEVAEEVRRELNAVLRLYSRSGFYKERPDLLNKLKQLLEVKSSEAEELAEARSKELSNYSDANMGTKVYAALLSIARGGIYGHAAMLLMMEGALADVVLLTPTSAHDKAKNIAKGRGEAVDPSRSPKGAVDWEDRAASALLRYLLGRAVSEDLVFRRVEGGFEVFRAYGGVEARVDVLKIGEVTRSKAGEEELRRFVEEAERTAPDLSGIKKIWQALPWLSTDVSFTGKWIVAATADTRQAAWYVALFGKPKPTSGSRAITGEGHRLNVQMCWPRKSLDDIIAEGGKELKPLLGPVSKRRGGFKEAEGPAVNSWRELVDAIDWSWVLRKVEVLAGELKPWIGPEKMSDAERKGLVRRMLGELALLAYFAETRRGMDDGEWREERAKRLAEVVEALSGGRITSDDAKELAKLIIRYAKRREERTKERIKNLAEKVGVSKEDVWGVVERVLSGEDPYAYCLARDCARDEVVRKFVEPALELIMLDKARRGEFDRERAKLIFGEMYATALAGDGSVEPNRVVLAVGGELGGGAALLRLATLHLLNQLLSEELKFKVRIYVGKGAFSIIATSKNAARFMRLLAVSAPSAGGKYLSPKFDQFVEAAKVEVRIDNIRQTDGSLVVADLTISEGGFAVKYNVYLRDLITLRFESADRSRVELAVSLLKLAGVSAEVEKDGGRDEWYVEVTIDKLAAGRKELRDAVRKVVEEALKRGGVDEEKARRWLEKLEEGRVLMEGWPKFYVGLAHSGSLEVRFVSTNSGNIEQVAQWLEKMGLKRGDHFTVKMPDGRKAGYVSVLKGGLAYAAWLSENSENKQQRELAAAFVEYILKRAEKACGGRKEECAVYKKAKEIVEEGKAWGSIELKKFEMEFEVNGKKYKVKITGGEAVEEGQNGKPLLRIKIKAEVGRVEGEHIVDPVEREYTITYIRRGGDNAVVAYAYAEVDDAKILAALIETLTGVKPKVYRMKNGKIKIECYREHLEGFMYYAELAEAIMKWLKKTSR
jgi:hypothetical protein